MSLGVKRSVRCRSTEAYVPNGDMLVYDEILPDATITAMRHDVVRG